MKKTLSILLAASLMFSVIPMSTAFAETEGAVSQYKYETVIDVSDYEFYDSLDKYADPWYTEGLSTSYDFSKNGYDVLANDGNGALEMKRGTYDNQGLYYFNPELGKKAADSVGFRVWVKGGENANTTSTNNLFFIFDTIDGETHTAYAAAWWDSSNYKVAVPAEGAWVEVKWADVDSNFRENSKLTANRPVLSVGGGTVVSSSNWLSKMDGLTIGLKQIGASTYYIGDFQFIMPYTVKIDGETVGSGILGDKVKLPEGEVYGYSDGETLYKPGDEVTITGDVELTTIIRSIDASDFSIDVTDKPYTAKEIQPEVTALTGLVEGVDYEVTYSDNINLGTATVTVTGKGNYFGQVTGTFNITQKTITEDDFTFDLNDQTYTRSEIKPAVTAKKIAAADFDVAYSNNINKGTATITVTGKGNCTGEVVKTFKIVEKAIEEADFTFDLNDKEFTGSEIKPTVTSDVLVSDDYEVSYAENINVGTATITVDGKGNYKGQVVKTFKIVEKAIEDSDFVFDLNDKEFTGEAIEPTVTVNNEVITANDYEVAYTENVNAGTATITVTGKGNFKGQVVKTFTITAKALAKADFSEISAEIYANAELEPKLTIVNKYLTENDFDAVYTDNVNVGTATVTITGKNNFKDIITLTFEIQQKEIAEANFTIDTVSKVYTGSKIEPSVTSENLKDTDYTVTYENNIDKGTATITVTGKDNCKGEIVKEFEIAEKAIEEADFTIDTTDKVYTGEAIEPTVTVNNEFITANDYEVAYTENVNVGTATITVTGKGNFAEIVSKTFKIVEKAVTEGDFTFDLSNKVYTGKAITPAVASTLGADDYEVVYANNVNAGTATITVTGKGNYTAVITKTFVISKKAIDASMFAVNTKSVEYTGKAVKKTVSSSLALNKDYTVTYAKNKNVGTATITFTGIGNYSGKVVKTFKIVKPKVSALKGLKVKALGKKLKVSWKKVKGVNGYKIVYSTNKKFKKAKTVYVKNGKTAKKVLSKIKAGKYYVKAAAYKNYKNSKGKTVKAYGKYKAIKKAVNVK